MSNTLYISRWLQKGILAAAIIIPGCATPLPSDCVRVKVKGPTQYVVVYVRDEPGGVAWYLSAPGEGATPIIPPKILSIDPHGRLGVIGFFHSGKPRSFAYDWHERREQRRFCLVER